MKYVLALIAAATIATAAHADDSKDLKCNQATQLGLATFKAMQAGATEDQILDMLREREIYSGYLAWAAQQGMEAPADTPEWMLRGSLFGECMKRADI